MSIFKTNLFLMAAQLPEDFRGDPQALFEAMVERLQIVSPVGTNFFVVGDSEPSSDQGPWLKNGDRWYVFSESDGGYVPINIDDSIRSLFTVGPNDPGTPGTGDPVLWLRTTGTRAIGWYAWTGTIWRAVVDVPPSGATADRPTDPVDLEQFFDTDINVLLHWERGAWRTVGGSPGDIKPVTHATATDARKYNPGWEILGEADNTFFGRVLAVANKDAGATPVDSFPVGTGITSRAQGTDAGEETHKLIQDEHMSHSHVMGHATALNSDNNIQLARVDDGETVSLPAPAPPNYFEIKGEGTSNGTKTGEVGTGPTGTQLVTSRPISQADFPAYADDADPHNTIQPTKYVWFLVKS